MGGGGVRGRGGWGPLMMVVGIGVGGGRGGGGVRGSGGCVLDKA